MGEARPKRGEQDDRYLRFTKNVNSLFASPCESSACPVWRENASKSFTEPGSVDTTFSTWPDCSSFSAFLVRRMGSGQLSPRVSSSRSKFMALYYAGMKPLSRRSFAALLGAAALAPLAVRAQDRQGYKVVLQVSDNDPAKWNLALNNARNIQQDLGKDHVAIEIVAYGPGLPMLKADSKVAGRLAQALDSSIGLMACENTMHNTRVTKDQMYSGISYVDAGVVHIMKRQREGWQYIRP
jgi:uncharacterized protein